MDQPKSSKEILYRLEYHEVLGDVVATLLMSQIHYWYSPAKNGASKLRVYREGKWWIAKAVSDWGRECGLSDMQVRRGLKLLQQVGLVEIDTFMLGRNPVTHLRFLAIQGRGPINDVPDLSLILVKSGGPFVTGNTPLVTDNNPLVTCNTYPVTGNESITVDYTETTQKLLQGVSDATEVQSLTYEPGEVMAVPLSTKGKAHDSSKTILANLKGVTKVADDYQVSPAGLYLLWVNTVPEFHENVGCQKKWTLKQSANMKRLIELWDRTLPGRFSPMLWRSGSLTPSTARQTPGHSKHPCNLQWSFCFGMAQRPRISGLLDPRAKRCISPTRLPRSW